MGLRAGRLASPSRGVLQLLRLPVLLLLLLSSGARGAESQGNAEVPTLYLWKTGPWGRCMGDDCGPGGIQTRAVWCAHVEGWTTLHTNCKQAGRPSNQQNCFRVCDWHKELYDWRLGPWNQCQPVISKSLEKTRECVKGEEGIQVREITCIQKDKDIPAEDIICEYKTRYNETRQKSSSQGWTRQPNRRTRVLRATKRNRDTPAFTMRKPTKTPS